ncbi:MAG: hypothetical protein M1829_001685 [Trizodia sp. TS-e1964]|nr:MAG: hypothetical protein M1829_001685 [Trizodia sp. TS-e1964]
MPPPRLNIFSPANCFLRPERCVLALRSSTSLPVYLPIRRRPYSNLSEQDGALNKDILPHVSEEAAEIGRITGEGGPDLGQATPVLEILERDTEAQKKAPQVIQEELSHLTVKTPAPKTSSPAIDTKASGTEIDTKAQGHKYGLPDLPLPSDAHLKYRYDPVVKQVTNLLMRHGKLGVAQRNMSVILHHLQTSSPPKPSPNRPLLPSVPPPSHLPLNPILYLTLAIDSVAPLLRIRSQKGAAGGGMALQIPVPLGLRQRRRRAMQWILEAASKRQFRGSGRGGFAQRVAEEIVAVAEGRSGVWERRSAVHKLGMAARANINTKRRR